MNKTQLTKALNNQIEGQTIKSLTLIIDTVIELITAELKANNKVSFQNFLIIENVKVKGRSGDFNGVAWQTKDRLIPRARLMKKFKEEVQNGK